MRTPRITRATLGVFCNKCKRPLDLGERFHRGNERERYAAMCNPCMAPELRRAVAAR